VKIDLQDLYRANPKAFVAAGVVIGACFVVLLVKGLAGTSGGHGEPAAHTRTVATSTNTTTVAQSGVTTPNPNYHPSYATNVPSSPIDQKLASEMGQSGNQVAAIEAITPAPPAWTTAYPQVPPSATKDETSYAVAFIEELLDRNYRTQSREDLARWVSAEAADEMLPGVPAEAGGRALYAELIDPAAVGGVTGPVPSAGDWNGFARADVTEHVYDVLVNPDAAWSAFVSKGFTSADPLLTVVDVTGVIATTKGRGTTTKHFSLQLFLGSALHHPGYGSWGIDQWAVN